MIGSSFRSCWNFEILADQRFRKSGILGGDLQKLPGAAVTVRMYESLDSTLDEARRLFKAGRLACWDSILAAEQTAGRGQKGRSWISDRGNLFSAVRLPVTAPFSLPCAPLALSLIYCETLTSLGFDCLLKWPNDLVIRSPRGFGKCSGTLLERKGELLVAGTGINIESAPSLERMRDGAVLPAVSLREANPQAASRLTPKLLWENIMSRLTTLDPEAFARTWHERAASRLLWRGERVRLDDGRTIHEGELEGLANQGELILRIDGVRATFVSGTLLPPRNDSPLS